jgi:hypothetical protein
MKRITLFSIIANAIVVLLAPLVIWSQTYTNIRITTNTNDQSETAVAIDPLNSQKLMATWNSFSASAILPPGYSFSTDGGLTWSTPAGVPSPPSYDRGFDPSCTFDRLGNAFYCYIASTGGLGPVYVSKTTNLGTSWTHANVSSGTSDDKPFITVDNTGGARNGRLYVVWTEISGSYPNFTYKIHAAYSSNNGTSFTRASTDPLDNITSSGNMISFQPTQNPNAQLSAFVSGAMPAVAPNGDLYVAWLRNAGIGTGSIRIRKSTDGGLTFGTTYTVANVTPFRNFIGNLDILNFPSIGVDQNTGRIYVAYTDKPGNNMNVYYNYSTNGGQTWSSRTIATQDTTGNQFFAALSVDPTGKIILGYYDDRSNPNVDVYLAESFNNGVSFATPNIKVTSGYSSNNPANSTWTHHYFGVTSTVGFAYPLWTDYRNLNADIYFARVNRAPSSNAATATAGNGQRKMARDANGTYHQVFESNQDIWYARKTSTDAEWNNYQRLNSGTVTSNSSPCIVERGGKVYVIWQKLNGSSYDVYFHKSTDGGTTWPDANRQTLATGVGSNPPLPVIISPATDKLTVAYRTNGNLSYKVSNNNGSSWTTGTVPSTGANDNSPTLAPTTTYWGSGTRSCLVYANTSPAIYYRYYRNGPDSTEGWNSSAVNLSQIVPGTYNSHKKPSIAPSGTAGDKRLHAVWEARSGTSGNYYVIIHRKATDWGTWPNVYSATYYEEQQQPSVTGLHDDTAELLFRMVSLNYVYKMHYDGSYWGGPVFVGTGAYPSVSVGNTTAKYVWTDGNATPYQIKLSSETLSKSGFAPLTIAYHRSMAVLDPAAGAWFDVRLDKLSVKTRTGTELLIPFVDAKEDLLTLTPANAFINLASSLATLPTDAESLSVQCVVSGQGLAVIKSAGAAINAEIIIAGTNGITIKVPVLNTTAATLPETKFLLSTPVTNFAGAGLSLRTIVSGIANNKASLIASLGHIYEVIETSLPKTLEEVAKTLTPNNFVLEAYPNPFNPSTQIRFVMKEAGVATLRVYNLNGQLIRELLNEYRAAGEHTMPWNGRDHRGITSASGVYFIRFEAGNQVKMSKVMLLR